MSLQNGVQRSLLTIWGSVAGKGSDTNCADTVVAEIIANNGHAIANHDSVVDGEKIVDAALDEWGRIDVLLNNAGLHIPLFMK